MNRNNRMPDTHGKFCCRVGEDLHLSSRRFPLGSLMRRGTLVDDIHTISTTSSVLPGSRSILNIRSKNRTSVLFGKPGKTPGPTSVYTPLKQGKRGLMLTWTSYALSLTYLSLIL